MIVSAIIGLAMNVLMVDNATGQNMTRAILLGSKVVKIQKDQKDQKLDIGVHDDE